MAVILALLINASFGAPATAQEKLNVPADTGVPLVDLSQNSSSETIRSRDRLTGDWGGFRTTLENYGVKLRVWSTEFFQGSVSGGAANRGSFGSKFNIDLSLDGRKLGLWKGLTIETRAEARVGQSPRKGLGLLLSPNFAMSRPLEFGDVIGLPVFKITQKLSDRLTIFAGRVIVLDGYRNAFADGMGETKFMNTGLVAKPVLSGQMTYSAWTAGAAINLAKNVVFKAILQNPFDVPTRKGFDTLGSNGISMLYELAFPTKFGGLPGSHIVDVTWSNKDRTSLDSNDAVIIPGGGIRPGSKDRSWGLYYQLDQFLWTPTGDRNRGWGLFAQISVSDGNPDPLQWFVHGGVGGVGVQASRPLDRWGIGYFDAGISNTLRRSLTNVLPLRDELGFEAFYSIALTPWARLSPDVQVIQPGDGRRSWTVIPGLRLRVEF